jgi:hypothetical protein
MVFLIKKIRLLVVFGPAELVQVVFVIELAEEVFF